MPNFPASPTVGQKYTYEGRTWIWDGVMWAIVDTGSGGISDVFMLMGA